MTKRASHKPPPASSPAALIRMKSANTKNTKPEVALRKALFRLGLRYRIDAKPLADQRRKADLVFRKAKVAVYVDGCFWHGCPIHGTWPKNNADFWRNKIETNQRRDQDTNDKLAEAGWLAIRVWEHEDAEEAAQRIEPLIRARLTPEK